MKKLAYTLLFALLSTSLWAQYVFNKLSSVSTPAGNAVFVSGTKAYVAAGTNGVFVYNISDPSAPTLLGSYNTDGEAKEIAAAGNYIYVADGTGGFVTLDASNLSSITMTDSVKFGSPAKLIALSGTNVLIVTNDNTIYRISVSNPSNLVVTGSYYTGHSLSIPEGIFAKGNYLYMAENGAYGGFEILDINAGSIIQKSKTSTPGFQYDVFVEDTIAFLFEGNRLRRYGITDPVNPVLLSTYNIGDKKYEIAPSNELVVQMGSDLGAYKQDTLVASFTPGFSRYEGIFTMSDTVFAVGDSLHIFILKKQTPPAAGAFNLLLPLPNTKVLTNANNNNALYFFWNKSTSTSTYRHFVIPVAGSFSTPWINMPSSFSGTDTTIRHLINALDTLAAVHGILRSDSILLKWTVYAYSGNDSMMANQSYNFWLLREGIATPPVTLGIFHLLSPPDSSRIVTGAVDSSYFAATWSKSTNATQYKFFLTGPTGSFIFPILRKPTGTDTFFVYPNALLDTLAAAFGIARGDSIKLKWTVYSYLHSDSLKASQNYTFWLVRKSVFVPPSVLKPFVLLTPTNEERIDVAAGLIHPVNFVWTSAGNGLMYNLRIDTVNGSFSQPWAFFPSNNMGLDTALSIPGMLIDSMLAMRLVDLEDSITLIWTVQASNGTDTAFANASFKIKFVRKSLVGVTEQTNPNHPLIYPNPSNNRFYVNVSGWANVHVQLFDICGKEVLAVDANETGIDISHLERGIYFVRLALNQGTIWSGKLIKD